MLDLAFGLLPRSLRQRLVLSGVTLDADLLRRVRVKVATTREEMTAAARLVHDAYVGRGIMEPHPTGLKLSPHVVVPSTAILVAIVDGAVIGTLSLVLDSPLGLPMDASFRREVDQLRRTNGCLAEVSALAVAKPYRKSGATYLLYRLMIRTAMSLGVDRVTMTVHPRARVLYETAMLFELFAGERAYAGLSSSARAVAMSLDLHGLRERVTRTFGHLPDRPGNPDYLYFRMDCPQVEELSARELWENEERISSAEALVRARMDVFRELPDTQLAFLKSVLKGVIWPSRSRMDWSAEAAQGLDLALALAPA